MSISADNPPVEHLRLAEAMVDEMYRLDGLASVDLNRIWADQDVAVKDPWSEHIQQLPFGAATTSECVYDELGIPEDYWRYAHDETWRLEINKTYNDHAEPVIGRRLLGERAGNPNLYYPSVGGLHDVFEARNIWHGQSWWLQQSVDSEDDLRALLDRVDQRDVRATILPDNWTRERDRLMALGIKPPLYRHQRGPVTFATSIFGVENFLMLILDQPDLAARLRDSILRVMLEIGRILDEEGGYTFESAPHGFSFADDNCCLLTPTMYEFFALPVLKGMFDRYSPLPHDLRYQHSDSDMGHILPHLATAQLNAVNFGPKVLVEQIRQHLPKATIYGVLAPFTYSRNEHVNIVLELLRDWDMAKEHRGLVFATAGSVNNGSSLRSMRLIMAAIQRYCRWA